MGECHDQIQKVRRLGGAASSQNPPLTPLQTHDLFQNIEEGLFVGNKSLKRRMVSLEMRIAEHLIKINIERDVANPNIGLIKHWEAEIYAFTASVERVRKRLG